MNRFIFFFFILLSSRCFAQIPTSGLIGSWPFSGNANDVSGSANHGTVTGAALVADRCGNANSAYNFTGSDYIMMAVPGPTGTAARSVCFWARSTNTVSGSFLTPVVPFDYGGSSSSGGSPFQIVWNYCSQALGVDCGTNAIQRGTACINNGQWHFYAFTYDPSFGTSLSDVKIYIDAVQQTNLSCSITGTTQSINTAANSGVTIGKAAGWPARYFLGSIDDVLLYNRALTATEISQMYTVTPCTLPISGSTLVCPGSSYVYSVAPVTGATYTWSLPAGWTGTSSVNSISVVAGLNGGSLSVVGSSSCGATPPYTLTVSTAATPTITANSNFPFTCPGGTVTLSALGASSYTWQSPLTVSPTMVVSPTITTSYTVRGTNTLTGCTGSTSITQTVVTTPTVIPASSGSLSCAGNTASLSVTGATSYTWQPGGLTGSFVTVSPTVSTIYTVTGHLIPNCSNTATILITSAPALSLNITGTFSACIPSTVSLSAAASGGTGAYTYSWTGGPATASRTASQALPGVYTYTANVSDGNGCSMSRTTALTFYSTASVTPISSTICPNTTGTLSASGLSTYTWYPGASTGSLLLVNPTSTSIYTVRGASAQGCTATAEATITVKPGVTLTFNTFTITCANLGSATVTPAGTPGPFTYSWMPTGQTGSVATGLFPGTYSLDVFDASTGCLNTGTTSFAPLVPLTGTVSASDSVVCYGDATGSASIALSGGSGAQTYTWTNSPANDNSASPNTLVAGVHTVTVVDALTFCSVTHTFFIGQPPAFTLHIAASSPSVCLGGNISYTANISGGTPLYSYNWNTTSATNTCQVSETTAGSYVYTLNVLDSYACPITQTVSAQFVPNPTVSVNSSSICPLEIANLTAGGASSYTWSSGFSGNPLLVSPSSNTTYVVVGSALGCTAASVGTVVVKPLPIASFTTDAPRCNGEVLHLFAAPEATAYVWTGPQSFTANSQFTSLLVSPANSGVYNLTVTAANGCTASSSSSVTIYPTPSLSVSGSTVCEHQSLNLSCNFHPNAIYNWLGPNGHVSSQMSPVFLNADVTMSGTYQLTVTSVHGCTNTAAAQASVVSMPTVLIQAPAHVCLYDTLWVSGTGGDSYNWFGPNSFFHTQSSFSLHPLSTANSGIYNLQVMKGPCFATGTVNIVVQTPPQLTVTMNSPLCQNQTLQLDASGASTYSWMGSDGFTSTNNPVNISMGTNGMVNYTLVAEDAFGCKSATLTPVLVLPAPVISVAPGTVCLGGPLTMTASGAFSYAWSGPNGFNENGSAVYLASVVPVNAGVYTVTGVATNSCSSSATTEVIIMPYAVPSPTVSLSSKSACLNSNLRLTGAGGQDHRWFGPGGLLYTGNPLLLSNITPSMAGVYTLSVKNESNCIGTNTVLLTVYPQPQANIMADKKEVCAPACVQLNIVKDSTSLAPLVSTKLLVNTDQTPLPANRFCSASPGAYVLKALFTDTNACSNTATLQLTVRPKPLADFLSSPSRPFAGIDVVSFHNNTFDDGGTSFYWYTDFNDPDTLYGKEPKYMYDKPGEHYVTMLVINKWGCADTSIQLVMVEDEYHVYMPNAFTPNNDGLNDVFGPKGSGIQKLNMRIFDRWGQLLFETDDVNKPWDGTFKGQLCKAEVYVWLITLVDSGGKRKQLKGNVLLLKTENPPAEQ